MIVMKSVHISAVLVLVLGVSLYRRGDTAARQLFDRPEAFPRGFFAGGDYERDCTTLGSLVDGPGAEMLRFCEDATLWDILGPQGEVLERPLIASCDSGRRQWNTVIGPLLDPKPHGTLWLYVAPVEHHLRPQTPRSGFSSSIPDTVRGKPQQITLINYPPSHDFHPLGTAIWPSRSGNASNLYVVNHARHRSVIEHFVIQPEEPTKALYIRTIKSRLFVAPNALALTSPDSFFLTNDHLMTRRIPLLGDLLSAKEAEYAIPLGSVLHVALISNGRHSARTVVKTEQRHIRDILLTKLFIPFANGIALSPSGNEVAVAATSLGEVHVYDRDPSTNALNRRHKITVPFRPDNLHYEAGLESGGDAELIIAGHPDVGGLIGVSRGVPNASAKSWVVTASHSHDEVQDVNGTSTERFTPQKSVWKINTIFQSDGVEETGGFGTSTTGLRDSENAILYVPGLYAKEGVMMCRRRPGTEERRDF